jgi:hypothetical protein
MTEQEWLACRDPNALLECLRTQHGSSRRKAGQRKVRLFGCASCRLFGVALSDPRSIAAVEFAERYADGDPDTSQLSEISKAARRALIEVDRRLRPRGANRYSVPELGAAEAAFIIAGTDTGGGYAHWAMRTRVGDGDRELKREWEAARVALAELLRDIFGNPFRPVPFNPTWRTDTAMVLARQMYESREFGAMPILADALQDAGCEDEQILMHCRDASQPHVRGCWVCDLVLGKA